MKRALARLVHDVGKYVARTARNLPPEPAPALVAMLARDLYELRPGRRASEVLDELVRELSLTLADPRLAAVRALLAEADALEPEVRAGSPEAVARAARLACEVERRLRALAHEAP